MKNLAQLKIPGYGEVEAPPGIPQGGSNTLETIISVGLQIFLIVVIIAALFYLVWAGIRWIQSSGDPTKIDEARKQIIFAIIGLVVAFLAFGIINLFGGIFGIKFI